MERFVAELPRVATDAIATAPVLTMPWWLSDLHGLAAELGFWCAIFAAVGRFVWLVWDFADRIRKGRAERANRSPVNGLNSPEP